MDETTFFEYEGVRITNSRFIVDGQTFAMNNITSVKSTEQTPSKLIPGILILIGILTALNGAYGGLALSAIGAAWIAMQKTTYHVMLHTAGGETSALKSHQKEYVLKVIAALNDAIVHRG